MEHPRPVQRRRLGERPRHRCRVALLLGVTADGHVVATGRAAEGQIAVDEWEQVRSVACGDWHSLGLQAAGRVLAAGNNRAGQLNVHAWRDVVQVAAGYQHSSVSPPMAE